MDGFPPRRVYLVLERQERVCHVDRNGQVQCRAAAGQIQDVKGFRNGLTPVKTKTGWGIMDHQGQWIVEPQYKDITMV